MITLKNILEELYFGNISPNISCFEHNPNYVHAMEKSAATEENLLKLLDEPTKSMFITFCNAQNEMSSITDVEKFNIGFKLGALLMIEIFTDKSSDGF